MKITSEEKAMKESNAGAIVEQDFSQASGHLGSIWEAVGKYLGRISEALRRGVGGSETFGSCVGFTALSILIVQLQHSC